MCLNVKSWWAWADGYIFDVDVNRLMNYVAVSCGACDRDTATRLKSGEVIRALLSILVGIPSNLRLGFHYFKAIFEGGESGPKQEVGSCINLPLQPVNCSRAADMMQRIILELHPPNLERR